MKVNENEYRLDFFTKNKYIRKTCKNCNTPFWTIDPTKENCADIPCSDYDFLDSDIGKLNLSVREARKTFLKFFEKHGHTIIPPKPVVARWRDDLYLTIASIVDFQPHVTSGLVPPPANPLVVSQPCIRLEDVDNVGITFGRHLTTFEMGGHHAFNYPDKFVYWKDETANLAKEFFTQELKIPEELLNYKESWWEGGGNAGPCFEVTVGGLELATLVFMQYEIVNGEYVPLKLKIVDTGYGIERIAWFTQKTPTAFHAIYGNLVYTFFKKLNQNYVDDELLKSAARFAGRIDPDHPETIKLHREIVAKALGAKVEIVENELLRAARIFQVLDHTKTIALMLADGLVPSNSGEGYLGRLLIRRALRVLKLLQSDIKLNELIKEQIEFWKEDFPQLLKNKEYILDAIENEEEKYREILSRAPVVASTLVKKSNVDVDDLVKIYDTNGIPPDIIAEELKEKGIQIKVPHNFYAIVAKKHQSAPIKEDKQKAKLPQDVIEFAKRFDSTEKLYYKDQYQRSFTAKVLGVYRNFVILDRTTFYPEGGGQLGDTGILKTKDTTLKVIDTQSVGDVIVHILEREESNLKLGEEIYGEIDWQRRYRLMRHHTATHVILAAAKKLLGEHVWQAGAEKTPEKGRLDITHYRMLTQEEIQKIEDMANYVINDRRPVRAIEMDRMKAEMTYGVSIYEGGVVNKPIIRLLEIKDWDIESCGGTHVTNTNEIGGIKIVNVEKIQDGVIRLEYVAGDMVANYARNLENKLTEISKQLDTSVDQLNIRLKRTLEDFNELKAKLNNYRKIFEEYAEKQTKTEKIDGTDIILKIVPEIEDEEVIRNIFKKLTQNTSKTYVVTISRNRIDIACSKDLKVDSIVAALRNKGGKGGGKGTYGSIQMEGLSREEIINVIKDEIKRSLH